MSGEGDISVRAFDKVVVPGYATIVCDGLDAVTFIEEVVDGLRHQALRGDICLSFPALAAVPISAPQVWARHIALSISDCHRLSSRPCRSCVCTLRHIGNWLTRL